MIKAQQKLLDEKDELIEDKRDMIQVLDERISLGNEHISALNDQITMNRMLSDALDYQLKAANDKIAEQKDFIMERDEIIERMEKELR